jgi:hypothetical protein
MFYALLGVAFLAIAAFQVRVSLDTIHLQRNLDFYLPFVLPFTSRLDMFWTAWAPRTEIDGPSELRRGDRIVSVNGRSLTGNSVYLRELWRSQQRVSEPFIVRAVTRDSRVKTVEFIEARCTCGSPTFSQAVAVWLVPQLFCLAAGFCVVALRPSSPLAWAFLALMLSLSQLQFWEEPYHGFQLTASPMVWDDWTRVPGVAYRSLVQHLWPAALLGLLLYLLQPVNRFARRAGIVLVVLLGATAVGGAVLDVLWSENFVAFARVYARVEAYRTETLIAFLVGVTFWAWLMEWKLGLAALAITMAAVMRIYHTAPLPASGGDLMYQPTVPDFHNTRQATLCGVAVAYVLAALAVFRRRLPWEPFAATALFVPLILHASASWARYSWPLAGPFEFEGWPWVVLGTAACAVVCLARVAALVR